MARYLGNGLGQHLSPTPLGGIQFLVALKPTIIFSQQMPSEFEDSWSWFVGSIAICMQRQMLLLILHGPP